MYKILSRVRNLLENLSNIVGILYEIPSFIRLVETELTNRNP